MMQNRNPTVGSSNASGLFAVPRLQTLAAERVLQKLLDDPSITDLQAYIAQQPSEALENALECVLQPLVNTLLDHVIKGQFKEAEEFIKAKPKLLSILLW